VIPEPRLGFCRWDKGCYLDVHNEIWDRPGFGWVLGFTREPWPEEEGGHLTFHGDDKVTPLSSRPPGWNTLDIYTVHPTQRWHSVPLVRGRRTRWTLAGLLIEPEGAES
jgi:Rps23 Pro-64 3,4-dihydroxylase Tpa1-like proline 4-hydroxylase